MSLEQQLVEENRRLREELDALKRERGQPQSQSTSHSAADQTENGCTTICPRPPPGAAHPARPDHFTGASHPAPPAASPPVSPPTGPTTATVRGMRFHEDECLRSQDFKTQRTKAAKDAINDDVTHEFFSAHEKNTALNVQRDIKQSCRIAQDRMGKLDDALDVLNKSQDMVHLSSDTATDAIKKNFDRYRVQLKHRENSFMTDLENHRDGELRKIHKEKAIVVKLLSTLDKLVSEASSLMTGPDPDEDEARTPYKTLAEIKDEFTNLRQAMLPWDMGYLFDMITAKASEQMIDLRTTAVHDIISRLIEMLSSARDKASVTLDTLNNFIVDVEKVVPEAMSRIQDEFKSFDKIANAKEELFCSKVSHYHRNYSNRIDVERECIEEWLSALSNRCRSSKEAVESGNDHRLLKELELLNQSLVQVDGSTLTLGYDNVSFKPVDSVLNTPLDQLGILVRDEMPYRPKISPTYHYYQFLEHKEFMYGGSETQAPANAASGITKKERALFESCFARIDRYKDGTLSEEELEVLWSMVFSAVPRQAISCITSRIFEEINTAKKDRILFDDFLSYISEGMHTNLGAQRDQFYRSTGQAVEDSIISSTVAPAVAQAAANPVPSGGALPAGPPAAAENAGMSIPAPTPEAVAVT